MWWILISCPSLLQVRCCWLTVHIQAGWYVVVTCWVYPRGRAFCCGAFRAAGSCGEEGGAGFPHCSGKEDGQLPSGAQICQGKTCLEMHSITQLDTDNAVGFWHKVTACSPQSLMGHTHNPDKIFLSHRPSCCPLTTPVQRRFWALCLCYQWTLYCITLLPGGKRCLLLARNSPPAKETTWHCSTFTGHSRKSAVIRRVRLNQ